MQKFTKEQGIVVTGYTGITAVPFGDFHKDVEKRLGRSVYTHEFAEDRVVEEIKEAYRDDFIAMYAE